MCCDSAEQCAKLNKNYPLCSELTAKADYTSGAECAAADDGPKVIPCSGNSTQACGCNNGGTQTRTCDTTTGTWSTWSSCSISDACECTETPEATSQACNTCGTQTRTVTCNAGQVKKCIGGTYRCITPCPPGGCANGTTNPAEDISMDNSVLGTLRLCRVITICPVGGKMDSGNLIEW